uniref:Uncharacterized protein n=1 Tax=Glossina pallidipes TaxID=7398 RepID=A0A1A9Z5S7_GLOPL
MYVRPINPINPRPFPGIPSSILMSKKERRFQKQKLDSINHINPTLAYFSRALQTDNRNVGLSKEIPSFCILKDLIVKCQYYAIGKISLDPQENDLIQSCGDPNLKFYEQKAYQKYDY